MYKDSRYINAGTNEFYRYGHKAVEMIESHLEPNDKGFYSIPADGGKYYTFGTSDGKFGEYAKIGNTFFSVNKGGFIWAKAGTEKGDAFVSAMKALVAEMHETNHARVAALEAEEDIDF